MRASVTCADAAQVKQKLMVIFMIIMIMIMTIIIIIIIIVTIIIIIIVIIIIIIIATTTTTTIIIIIIIITIVVITVVSIVIVVVVSAADAPSTAGQPRSRGVTALVDNHALRPSRRAGRKRHSCRDSTDLESSNRLVSLHTQWKPPWLGSACLHWAGPQKEVHRPTRPRISA